MTAEEYVQMTRETATYPNDRAMEYLRMGLIGELGEVAELLKREVRGDGLNDARMLKLRLTGELGDVLWYCTRLADEAPDFSAADEIRMQFEADLDGCPSVVDAMTGMAKAVGRDDAAEWCIGRWVEIADALKIDVNVAMRANAHKLRGRLARGTLHGHGEDR